MVHRDVEEALIVRVEVSASTGHAAAVSRSATSLA